MKIRRQHIGLLIALIVISTFGTTFAQDTNPALKVYQEWRAKNLTKEMSSEGNHVEIAFAVSRYEKIGATINIVVGVGSNVNGLGEMQFIVQPMTIKKSPDGKTLFEETEGRATLVCPELSDADDREDDILASPQLTIKAPSDTEAIKIIVKESSAKLQYSITLALKDVTTTAVLAGVIDTKTESLGKCFGIM